jgi:hypothetical protein
MKIICNSENNSRTKLGMKKIPIGVVKRKFNPNGLHKIFNSRNKKKCFICNTYDNIIVERVVMFGHDTVAYVCIECRNKEQIKK